MNKPFSPVINKKTIKNMVILLISGGGLLLNLPDAMAQQEEIVDRLIGEQQAVLERLGGIKTGAQPLEKQMNAGSERIRTYICPKDGREFQLVMASNGAGMDGMRPIYCPYDGFQFYPSPSTESTSKGTRTKGEQMKTGDWYNIRSPSDGRQFKARINVEELVNGNTVFTSPFDGVQFRFVPEVLQYTDQGERNIGMMTLTSPSTGKKFRAVVNNQSQLLTDPYTSRALPASQFPVAANAGTTREIGVGEKNQLSGIEAMFNAWADGAMNYEQELEQFGYAFFPTAIEISELESEKNKLAQQRISRDNLTNVGGNNAGISSIGQGLFSNSAGSSLYGSMLSSTIINKDYTLGPGDLLIVYMWGKMQQVFPLAIDAEGKVFLPEIGPVYLTGVTFERAEKMIQQRLAEKFTNFEMSISMGRLRTISLFIFGEVQAPGAQLVNSQSNILQTLFIARGVTKTGSLRKIKLVRNQEEHLIDLYEILIEGVIEGDKEADIQIQQNDIILVPPIGEVAAIKGSVKRPAIYELAGATSLAELIKMAGGLTAKGYAYHLKLERVVEHQKLVVKDLEFDNIGQLNKQTEVIEIQDGDLVSIFSVAPVLYNYVSIEGSVLYPGDYEWKPGIRVKTLLEKAGGLTIGAYFDRADIIRKTDKGIQEIPINLKEVIHGDSGQNLELQQWDRLKIYNIESVVSNQFVEISGAVRKPGAYPLSIEMRLSDLIFKADGIDLEGDLQTAEFIRVDLEKGVQIMNVNLKEVLQDKAGVKDFLLQEGDHLFVRFTPESWQRLKVTVTGEVKYPGEYIVRKGESLSALIERAGGFTKDAYPYGAIFKRASIRAMQAELLKRFVRREQQTLLQEQASLSAGFSGGQAEARTKLIEFQDKALDNGSQEDFFTGRLIVHLEPYEQFKGAPDDMILQDNDFLFVPPVPSYVLVVNNQQQMMTVTYEEGKGVEYYLRRAGGLQKYDDGRSIYIVTAAGELKSKFVKSIIVHRGDAIVVPQKIQYRAPMGLVVKDTISTLYQIGLGAIAVASINN